MATNSQICEYVNCNNPGDQRVIVARYNVDMNVSVCTDHADMLRMGLPIALYFSTYLPDAPKI